MNNECIRLSYFRCPIKPISYFRLNFDIIAVKVFLILDRCFSTIILHVIMHAEVQTIVHKMNSIHFALGECLSICLLTK